MQDYNIFGVGGSAVKFRAGMPGAAKGKPAVIFVDPSARDVSPLIADAEKRAELIFLNAERDGLEQIAGHLGSRGRLSLIHLLADFSLGRLVLGNKVFVVRSLRDAAAMLRQIGKAVSGGGEIVIGSGGAPDGQGDNFRRAFEGFAAAPVRLWDGGARRRA
jgi:Domain of unknown function (DUF4347)